MSADKRVRLNACKAILGKVSIKYPAQASSIQHPVSSIQHHINPSTFFQNIGWFYRISIDIQD
jgi:sorbitol-specific phosphotransferase system component IIC